MTSVVPNPNHPAKWSKPILDLVGRLLDDEARRLGRRLLVVDPMGGVGRIHDLDHDTVSGDIEIEWAACRRPCVQADAAHPPFRPGCFDAYATSCVYGNRMSDSHRAGDRHKKCGGAGCKGCGGTGLSPRKSYTHAHRAATGRPLRDRNVGKVHWGPKYQALQGELWAAAPGYVRPGGLVLANTSNFVRDKEVVDTLGWHLRTLRAAGLVVEDLYAIPTSRMKFGENYDARVPHEHLIVLRRPTDAGS